VGVWNSSPLEPKRQRCVRRCRSFSGIRVILSFGVLLLGYPILAQSPPTATSSPSPNIAGTASLAKTSTLSLQCAASPASYQPSAGTLNGTVADSTGTAIPGAIVTLTRDEPSPSRQTSVDEDGQFSFANVVPGPFQLAIASPGFTTLAAAGTLVSGQSCVLPRITLLLATTVTEVRVELTPVELAQEQLREQEKQRVMGVIPNFYVTYVPHAVPLTSKQKFELAWKSTIDPVSFGVTAAVAGVQQATNTFSGYGQGAQGYGKRYGAAYADFVTGTYIGGAIFPSLLKQDPRYFYKGTGSVRSRALYAMANAVICKGDNGHWQPNYSGIMGSLASGGISNLYYPPSDRSGVALTFENTLIGIGETAAVNLLQEFVIRKITPNIPNYEPPATP
jgi:Carboxypeptidase regulatory-like domain